MVANSLFAIKTAAAAAQTQIEQAKRREKAQHTAYKLNSLYS